MPTRFALFLAAVAMASGIACAQAQESPSQAEGKPAEVLYIGNSYTYYNHMPDIVSAMARSEGSPRELHSKSVSAPGATLESHWESGLALQAIHERRWDYVVLQEQSLLPLQDRERMFEYARLFNREIKLNDAKTVIFVTWARRDRPETQAKLTAAYRTIAEELGAIVAPVGPAWLDAIDHLSGVQLYEEDGSHPTPLGSYLTACVLYLTLQPQGTRCPAVRSVEVDQEAANVVSAVASAELERLR